MRAGVSGPGAVVRSVEKLADCAHSVGLRQDFIQQSAAARGNQRVPTRIRNGQRIQAHSASFPKTE